jgi:1,2-diacylglycerol 3-alpha-glucosyltransferase
MEEKLKVAFYTDTFLPAVDGVVTSILNSKKELEKRGDTVYVFAAGDRKTKQISKNHGNVIIASGIKLRKYPQYNLALFPFAASLRLPRSIDIIHAHTPFLMGMAALLLARLNKIPFVGSFHTMFVNKAVIKEYTVKNRTMQKLLLKHAWSYARFFYGKCNAVIAPSNAIKVMLEKHGIRNVYVVPNGIDTKRFDPRKVNGSALRKKLLRNRKDKLVLYIGRMSKEKNVEVLLKAAQMLNGKGVEFVLGGTGPAIEQYKRIAAELGLEGIVTFLGFVDGKQLPYYYAASDLLCLPSTFETQGIVALEAMAMGKPVVGANYLALKEIIINGRNGEKFSPNNARSCASKIEKVLNHSDKYNEMRQTAEKYSDELSAEKLLNVYKSILNSISNVQNNNHNKRY